MKCIFEKMGLNRITVFIIFIKAVIREQKIPFQISFPPFLQRRKSTILTKSYFGFKGNKRTYEWIEYKSDKLWQYDLYWQAQDKKVFKMYSSVNKKYGKK